MGTPLAPRTDLRPQSQMISTAEAAHICVNTVSLVTLTYVQHFHPLLCQSLTSHFLTKSTHKLTVTNEQAMPNTFFMLLVDLHAFSTIHYRLPGD